MDGIPTLTFAPDAQELFDQYRDELEHRVRFDEELRANPPLLAHISKFRSLMPAMALLYFRGSWHVAARSPRRVRHSDQRIDERAPERKVCITCEKVARSATWCIACGRDAVVGPGHLCDACAVENELLVALEAP